MLYTGDAKNKWSKPNSPTVSVFETVTPYDFALIDQLPNLDEASKMMLHQIDFNPDARQVLPSIPTTEELCQFRTTADRHGAYESLWRWMTYAGVIANTALWIGM